MTGRQTERLYRLTTERQVRQGSQSESPVTRAQTERQGDRATDRETRCQGDRHRDKETGPDKETR